MRKKSYKYPVRYTERGIEVVVYKTADAFNINYRRQDGRREILRRSDEAKAHKEAQNKLLELLKVPIPFASSADETTFRNCQASVAGLGVSPAVACQRYAQAIRALNGATLDDAVAAFHKFRPVKDDKDVNGLVKMWEGEMKPPTVSLPYYLPMRRRLRRFARSFGPRKVFEIETHEIETWLNGLAVGPRTRNNERETVLTFFNWAQTHRYISRDRQNEAVAVRILKTTTNIHIFTLAQMRHLTNALAAAKSELLRYAVTGLFAGVRPVEMSKLQQETAFRWHHDDIEIPEWVAKTGDRRLVPMEANWKAWVSPDKELTGSFTPVAADEKLAAFAKSIGLTWHFDIMRHSYISYMVAREKQIGCVAMWAGNSEYIIKKNYLKMVTHAEGVEYFNHMPPWPANVVNINSGTAAA